MNLSLEQWHQRYVQQARWTQNIRSYLYQKCDIQSATRVLDIGCGTGVLEHEFSRVTSAEIYAADLDYQALQFAHKYSPLSRYTAGDCLRLPFPNASFDITLCHFLLLWVDRIENALAEIVRVTRSKGYVLAMAEPDYGGRIDYPDELAQLGAWQIQSLREQGADPFTGRRLRSYFSRVGLVNIEVGVLGGQWKSTPLDDDFQLEWQVISSDLKENFDFQYQSEKFKALEQGSRFAHERILFVPVFYAIGEIGN